MLFSPYLFVTNSLFGLLFPNVCMGEYYEQHLLLRYIGIKDILFSLSFCYKFPLWFVISKRLYG